jgi:glycosyltransferase involved in cell wall biosynthesis
MQDETYISVIIATKNRSASLQDALLSIFTPQNLERNDWELIVVDNNSSDDTPALCAEFQKKFPDHFRSFVETKPGGSNAKNFGLSKARGEIIALTDDDVRCAPDYLQGIRSVFAGHNPDAVQGRVLLECEGGRPGWMGDGIARFMSERDFGDSVLPWNDNLSGTSMIVRATVFQKVGGFSPHLGTGTRVGFAEDSELAMRIRRAGFRLIYAPEILVWHRLPANRLTKSFIRKRFFACGRSYAYFDELPVPVWRFAVYVLKELFFAEMLAFLDLLTGHPEAALDRQCAARVQVGMLWQHYLFRRGLPRDLDTSVKGALSGQLPPS